MTTNFPFLGHCHSTNATYSQKICLATPEWHGGSYRLAVCWEHENSERGILHYLNFATANELLEVYDKALRYRRSALRGFERYYPQPDDAILKVDIYAGAHLRFTHLPTGQFFLVLRENFVSALTYLGLRVQASLEAPLVPQTPTAAEVVDA